MWLVLIGMRPATATALRLQLLFALVNRTWLESLFVVGASAGPMA
jgi:hypothetical protein